MKYEIIIWMDACASSNWDTDASLPKPVEVRSTGWVTAETEDHVTLSASYYILDGAYNYSQSIALPHGMIVSRQELEVDSV